MPGTESTTPNSLFTMLARTQSRRYLTALLLSAMTSAAQGATLYWDNNGTTSGLGDTGSWIDSGSNWSTDTAGTIGGTWSNANRDTADFRGTGGIVNVDAGGAAADVLLFGAGGYDLAGGTITLGRAAGTGSYTMINYSAGSAAVTIDSDLLLNDSETSAARTYTFTNGSGQALNLNGDITVDFNSSPTGTTTLSFVTGTAASSFTLGSQILKGVNGGTLAFSFGSGGTSQSNALAINGTFYVNGDNSAVTGGTRINGGTVVISDGKALGTGTITFGSSGARGDMTLLADGDITVANALGMSGSSTSQTIIGVTAGHEATFTGAFNLNAFGATPDPIFTAETGSKAIFSGVLNVSASVARGARIEGSGVVSFAATSGNTFKGLIQVNSGTLLLMNTSGSATGNASLLTVGDPGVIVAGGAALGGTGISTTKVSASAANSVFTPGDMTKDGVSSIGTLTLSGGLVAASGATFNFDLDGASIDSVDFGAGALDMQGVVTFNFTSLGTVLTGTTYTLFTGTGDWSSVSASFVADFLPSGYVLDGGYGTGGFAFDSDTNSLTVQFVAVPEPSGLALLGGLAALGWVAGRRRIRT